jgi:hypothetical protein
MGKMKDKKIYKKPEIEEYGTLESITKGGSGSNSDSANGSTFP